MNEAAMTIQGQEYPVLGTITFMGQAVHLLDIRMMSDDRERELANRKEATA